MRKTRLTMAVLASVGGLLATANANAALMNTEILTIDAATGTCFAAGTFPDCQYNAAIVDSGSYFNMDGEFGYALEGDANLTLGSAQPPTGNTPSLGNPYDGSGTNIVKPWLFFGNLGTNYTLSAPMWSFDGTNDVVDLSGWGVRWGEVPFIDMARVSLH